MGRALLASLLLHFVFIFVAWVLNQPLPPPPRPQTFSVELIDKKTTSAKDSVASTPSRALRILRQLSHEKFLKRVATLSSQPRTGSFQNQESAVFDDHEIFKAADEFIGENKEWNFYREVFSRVDSNLIYDSKLIEFGHFGSVVVRFRVDCNGTLTSGYEARATDGVLKVHALRALRSALRTPLPRGLWRHENCGQSLIAKFDFHQSDPSANFLKQTTFSKGVFIFDRTTLDKPVPRDLLTHLLNGGVSLDPSAMMDRWEKFNHRKYQDATGFDPFADYRRDPDY